MEQTRQGKRLLYCSFVALFILAALPVCAQVFQPRFVSLQGSRNFDDIQHLLPDSKNFLWFACNQGLVRFDGSTYQRFEPGPGNRTIPSDAITSLHEDSKGTIWIGTADKGLYSYQHHSDSFVLQHLPNNPANILSVDAYGQEVLVCTTGELLVIDVNNGRVRNLHLPDSFFQNEHRVIKAMEGSRKKMLWLLTAGGVYSFDETTGAITKFHSYGFSTDEVGNRLSTLVAAGNRVYSAAKNIGLVEASANGEAAAVKPVTNKLGTAYSTSNIDALYKVSDQFLLVGTQDSGVAVFETASRQFHFLQHKNFAEVSFVRFHVKAIAGNQQYIAMATQHDGIWVYHRAAELFNITRVPSQFNQIEGTLYARSLWPEPQKNRVFAGAYFGDGLYLFNSTTGTYETYPFVRNNKQKNTLVINAIFQDHAGVYWVATQENGALIFDESGKQLIQAADQYPVLKEMDASKIYCFYENAANELYIATGTSGLLKLDASRKILTQFRHKAGDSTSLLTDSLFAEKMFADRSGQLWLSTRSGISVLQPATGTFFHFIHQPGKWNSIPPAFWHPVAEDNTGNIYIGAGSGLFRLPAGSRSIAKARLFTENDGLAHHTIFSMVKDRQGLLWITCRSGISCFNPANNSFRNFNYTNGLPAKTLMAPMQLAPDGRIFHGAVDQFFSFDPDTLLQQGLVAQTWLSGFRVFNLDSITGLRLNNISKIVLTASQNSFSFSFVAPALSYPEATTYSWMLEGLDADWSSPSSRHEVGYTNLSPGNYVFKVRAVGPDGSISGSERRMEIIIVPPFWQRWWFRILACTVMLAIIYAVIRFRERQIAIKEAAKTELEKARTASVQYQLEIEQVIRYFASTIHEQNSIDALLWDVARNCISRLGFEDCVIYLLDPQRNVLVQKAAWGPKTTEGNKIVDPIEIPLGKGIVGSVAQTGKTEVIHNTATDTRYIVDDANRLSELTVPVMRNGTVLGIIDSEHSQAGFYTSRHVHIITAVASMLGDKIARMTAEQQTREKEVELLQLSKDLANWQITALRAQMNPHFIFNAINSIQQFTLRQDSDNANRYLSRFATLLRKVLQSSQQPTITLEEEVSQLRLYLELEKLRLGEDFEFFIEIDDAIEADAVQMPGMLLQPFIENAVKHGLPLKQGARRLTLHFDMPDDNHLQATITDNGIGRAKAAAIKESQKMIPHVSQGIELVRQRLRMLDVGNPDVRIIDLPAGAGTEVILIIPIA